MIRPYVLFDTLPIGMGVNLNERKNPQRVFFSSEFNFLWVIGINVASFWVSPGWFYLLSSYDDWEGVILPVQESGSFTLIIVLGRFYLLLPYVRVGRFNSPTSSDRSRFTDPLIVFFLSEFNFLRVIGINVTASFWVSPGWFYLLSSYDDWEGVILPVQESGSFTLIIVLGRFYLLLPYVRVGRFNSPTSSDRSRFTDPLSCIVPCDFIPQRVFSIEGKFVLDFNTPVRFYWEGLARSFLLRR